MKKAIIFLLLIIAFGFSLCNQSILVDRKVSDIPFTPNIFVSPSRVKKIMTLEDHHSGAYVGKLNDSIDNCRFVSNTPSNVDRVIGAVWQIKYKGMNQENLLNYLQKNGLELFDPMSNKDDVFSEKRKIFRNYHINQYLEGRYNKSNNSYTILYEYPTSYYDPYQHENTSSNEIKEPMPRYTLLKTLKDFFIGAPH